MTISCSAGSNQTVAVGAAATLTGTAEDTDPEADPLTYEWSAAAGVEFGDDTDPTTTATFPTAGNWTVTLHVTNGDVDCSAPVVVTVTPDEAEELRGWDPLLDSGGSGGGGVDEIGHGTSLPGDDDGWELFEVDGSPDQDETPDGLYRWDDQTGAWIQVGH